MKPKNKKKLNTSKTDNIDDYDLRIGIDTLASQGIHPDKWLDLENDGYTIIYNIEKED